MKKIIFLSREQNEDTYYFDGESHDFWEFVCVLDGSLGVTAGEDVCILEKGQSVLHRPMEFHRLWSEKSNYFSTVFKRTTGESPANYLRKQKH